MAKVSVETALKKQKKMFLKPVDAENVLIRTKYRTSVSLGSGLQLDLTQTQTFHKIGDVKRQNGEKKVEIELEVTDFTACSKQILLEKVEFVLKMLNQTQYILTNSVKNGVVSGLYAQFNVKSVSQIVRKPVSMQVTHATDYI